MPIKFEATTKELELIRQIAKRVDQTYYMDLVMDLEACHSNGCPLNFQKLLDFDFNHDIAGIRRHMDRDAGRLLLPAMRQGHRIKKYGRACVRFTTQNGNCYFTVAGASLATMQALIGTICASI